MSDFLQKIRNGANKRYENQRKHYDNPQYRHPSRGGHRDKKGGGRKHPDAEQLATIRKLLESIVQATEQEQLIQERTAIAIERIADALCRMSPDPDVGGETPMPKPQSAAPTDSSETTDAENDLIDIIRDMRSQKATYEQIAQHLETMGMPTPSGRGKWRGTLVSKLYKSEA